MTVREATIAKIQQMPEPLVEDVQEYVDFLLTRSDRQTVQHLAEVRTLTESDMADYLPNLEDYEERLARGEIKR